MSKRRFTTEQIENLSKNEFVGRCSEKSITYRAPFKLLAVKRYEEEGLVASQIFKEAGFDLEIIGRDAPDESMRRWRRIYKRKGAEGLSDDARGKGGGRPKTKGLTDAAKIERLEATVAYLKAENDFLAKLRAKRRE